MQSTINAILLVSIDACANDPSGYNDVDTIPLPHSFQISTGWTEVITGMNGFYGKGACGEDGNGNSFTTYTRASAVPTGVWELRVEYNSPNDDGMTGQFWTILFHQYGGPTEALAYRETKPYWTLNHGSLTWYYKAGGIWQADAIGKIVIVIRAAAPMATATNPTGHCPNDPSGYDGVDPNPLPDEYSFLTKKILLMH